MEKERFWEIFHFSSFFLMGECCSSVLTLQLDRTLHTKNTIQVYMNLRDLSPRLFKEPPPNAQGPTYASLWLDEG